MVPALLLTLLSQVPGFDSPTPWEKVSTEDGLSLERRSVDGSSSLEYRVTTVTPLGVDVLCEAIFEFATRGKDTEGLISRKELATGPDERVVYDQFSAPLVSNRDYAITARRVRPKEGECRIRFWATNAQAPKLSDGWVRLEKLYGGWTFTPVGKLTLLSYTVFVDPGGSVPSVFANGSQRKTAQLTVRQALKRAGEWKGPAPQ